MGDAPRAQDRCRPFPLGVDDSQGGIVAIDAATHPGGVVLGWIEKQGSGFLSDLALARFNGTGFETPKVYDVDEPCRHAGSSSPSNR